MKQNNYRNGNKKRRTVLYIPGNNPAMIQQGGVYGADSVLLDLEDAVTFSEKDAARILVTHLMTDINFYNAEVTVRVNHLDTPFGIHDLEAIVPAKPDAIRIPKIESKDEILKVLSIIERIESEHKIKSPRMTVHVMIETALGVENAFEIAGASGRIDAITIGGQDLTADMGIISSKDGVGIDYARRRIVMAAKAHKIDAIDTVFVDIDDELGLKEETEYIKKIGYTGKAVINPRQIDIIHEVYNPTEIEIRKALRIIKEFNENAKKGIGVFAIDGKMVDAPVITRAKKILDIAEIKIEELEK